MLMPLRSATSSAVKLLRAADDRGRRAGTRACRTRRCGAGHRGSTPSGGQLAQQHQALLAVGALQPVEQPLRREVDLLARHRAASLRQAGVRAAAQNHSAMIVLGRGPRTWRAPATASWSAARSRLLALDGGVIETAAGPRAGAPAGRDPRRRRGAAGGAPPPGDGARAALLRPERAHRLRRRAGPRGGDAGGRTARAWSASATPPSRSRAPSAATGAPPRSRSGGWWRRCCR